MKVITLLLVAFLLNGCSAAQFQRWNEIQRQSNEREANRKPTVYEEHLKAQAAQPKTQPVYTNCRTSYWGGQAYTDCSSQ